MKSNYTATSIIDKLYEVGICEGDDVFIHSNLGFFGILDGCKTPYSLCEAFVNAIVTVIGKSGTVITPAFSYSYCHGEIFDPYLTKTTCGMLASYMLERYPGNRTLDPNFSICGFGSNIEEYKTCNIHESFGKDCFWDLFKKNDGKIICMNFDAGSTFIHYIERQNNVQYRYNKAFNGKTKIGDKIYRDYAVHFVFDDENDAPCMERVDLLCRENNICKSTVLGKGTILSFPVNDYYNFFSSLLKRRPRVLCVKEEIT